MAAARLRGEVGAIEVGAEDACAAGAFALQPPAHVEERQVLLVAGDGGGGQQAGGAVAGVGAADGAEGVVGAVHEVGAGAAVDVQIDEAGDEIAASQVDDLGAGGGAGRIADGLDAPGGNVHLAAVEARSSRMTVPLRKSVRFMDSRFRLASGVA